MTSRVKSRGDTASYYELPPGASELQDLILYRGMDGNVAEAFRAMYRMGTAEHSDTVRDKLKVLFYIFDSLAYEVYEESYHLGLDYTKLNNNYLTNGIFSMDMATSRAELRSALKPLIEAASRNSEARVKLRKEAADMPNPADMSAFTQLVADALDNLGFGRQESQEQMKES